jgi:simple sugar transport system permease protein
MSKLIDLGRRMVVPALAVITAFIIGAVVIVLTDFDHLSTFGTDPIGSIGGALGGVAKAYGAMLSGAFGDPGKIAAALGSGNQREIGTAIRPITEILVATTPLIFTGLGVAISFRAGMFNIGGNGQLLLGALFATMTVIYIGTSMPAAVVLIAALIAGTLAGAAWGFIPGVLKAKTGAHEVITTIMLNYIASLVVFFALRSPELRAAGSTAPVSKNLNAIVDVPNIISLPSIRLDYGFVVALIMAVLVSWLLFRTTKGYELRAAGFSLTAARYAGMSAGGSMMLAMALSGALAGLGGAFMVIGTVGQLSLDIAGGIGFNAIALALLAGLRPSGIVAAALLFGALTQGGKSMGVESGIPFDLLFFIFSLVIMFVAAPGLIRTIWRIKVPTQTEDVTPVTPPASTTTPA